MDRDAHTRSDCVAVNPAGPEPRTHDLPWEVCGFVPIAGPPRRQRRGTETAEVSRGRSSSVARHKRRGRFPAEEQSSACRIGRRAESFNPRQYRINSMSDQRPQRTGEASPSTTFWEMLEQLTQQAPRPDPGGEEVIQPSESGESHPLTAKARQRALTARLMEQVCEPANLNRAYARVMANKGSPGVDGLSVGKLGAWIKRHKQTLIASLLDGSFQPQPVRGVQIPKSGGAGMRQLGIGHGGGPSGATGDAASARTDPRSYLLAPQLRLSRPNQRARRTEEGQGVRGRRTRHRRGYRP